MPNVIGVASTDQSDNVAAGSNTGSAAVAAPGTGILATQPGGGYGTVSGTSASSAEVAGLAALLVASGKDNAAASNQIRGATDPVSGASFGRINVARALGAPAPAPSPTAAPSAPPSPSGTPVYTSAGTASNGDGKMTVSPASVTAGSTGNTFTFTFTADNGKDFNAGSQVTVVIPSGWTQPTTANSNNPGYISVSNTDCTAVSLAASPISGSGPWTITINMTCNAQKSFTLNYGGGGAKVTAPATAGTYTFTTQTKQNSGILTNISSGQPTVIVTATTATKLAITSVNSGSNPTAGAGFAVVVQGQNNTGTPTSVSADTAVTLSLNTGSGTLGGTLTGTILAGQSSVIITGVTYTKAESGVVLTATRASGDALTAGNSAPFTVVAGAASKLTFGVQPSNTAVNTVISPSVTVRVEDASGNLVTASAASVTLAITLGTGTSGATLGGTTTVTAPGGLATFSTLAINKPGIGYTLTASSGALTVATSSAFNITAGAASKYLVTSSSSSPVAGSAVTITAQLADVSGNPVATSGKVVTWSKSGADGAFATATSTTNASGIATVAFTTGTTAGTTYTVTATDNTALTGTSAAFTTVAGAATKLVFTTAAQTLTAGAAAGTITVQLQDAGSNPVNAAAGGVAVSLSTNSTGGSFQPSSVTIAAGSSSATFTYTDTKAGTPTITATSSPLTSATQQETVAAAALDHLVLSPATATIAAGGSQAYTAEGFDQYNNSRGNVTAGTTFTITPNGSCTGASCTATVAGPHTVTGTNATKTGTASLTVNVGAVSAGTSTVTASPASVVANGTTTSTITVTLKDTSDNPVGGKTVTLAKNVGASSAISAASGPSSASGVVTFTVTNTKAEAVTYTATDTTDSLTITQTASVTFTAGAAATLAFSAQPTTTTAGQTIGGASGVTVQILDANNNLTASADSVTLAIGTNAGGGTLSGTTTVNAVGGVATFNDLSINKAGTGYTLTAASIGLTGATSGAFNVTAGAASKLTFDIQPGNTVAGAAISPAVAVRVEDASGNLVTTSAASVTLTIGTNPGGGTLSGSTPVAASGGVATFSDLSIDKAGTGYTLTASSGALIVATSTAFNVTAGAAATLALTAPSSATAGAAFGVTVTAKDANGNVATGYTGTVHFTGTDGAATLPANYTFLTADNGARTFPLGATLRTAGNQIITATDTVTATITGMSATIAVGAGALHHLVLSPATSTIAAGGSQAYTALGQDQYNNSLGDVTAGTIFSSSAGGSCTVASCGSATVGTYTVTGTNGGATGTATLMVTPGAAAVIALSGATTDLTSGATRTLTATIQDAHGNTVTGDNTTVVTFAQTAGSGSVSGLGAATASGGVATKTATGNVAGAVTITASASTLTSNTRTFNVVPGAASKLTFGTQPANTTVGGTSLAVTVRIEDASGNATGSTDNVTLAITTGTGTSGATLGGTTTVPTVAGVASFSSSPSIKRAPATP